MACIGVKEAIIDMEIAQQTVVDVRTLRASLRQRNDELDAELKQVSAQLASVDQTLKLLEPLAGNGHHTASVADITVDDIKHCKTQAEVLRAYAQLNGGVVNITAATDLIVKARMSKGKRSSVRSTMYNYVSKHPDKWQWVAPGNFQRVEDSMR